MNGRAEQNIYMIGKNVGATRSKFSIKLKTAKLFREFLKASFGCLYWEAWHCIQWNINTL
jgi:hypothetical protein